MAKKFSLSLSPIREFYRHLWNRHEGKMLLLIFGGGLFALVGAMFYFEESRVENIKIELQESRDLSKLYNQTSGKVIDGTRYFILNEDSVRMRYPAQNPTHELSYNFQTEFINIDGPGNSDRVLTFNEYDKAEELQRIRSIGCKLPSQMLSVYQQFKKITGTDFSAQEEVSNIQQKFVQKHCNGQAQQAFRGFNHE